MTKERVLPLRRNLLVRIDDGLVGATAECSKFVDFEWVDRFR